MTDVIFAQQVLRPTAAAEGTGRGRGAVSHQIKQNSTCISPLISMVWFGCFLTDYLDAWNKILCEESRSSFDHFRG